MTRPETSEYASSKIGMKPSDLSFDRFSAIVDIYLSIAGGNEARMFREIPNYRQHWLENNYRILDREIESARYFGMRLASQDHELAKLEVRKRDSLYFFEYNPNVPTTDQHGSNVGKQAIAAIEQYLVEQNVGVLK